MTQQPKAYYAVDVGQTGRGGGEQEQVTDHIPNNYETFLMETAGKRTRWTGWRYSEPSGCIHSVFW